MSEAAPEAPAESPAQETEQPAAESKPPAEEIDWKAKAREWERRAKENKTAADELAQIRESQKSEAEKVADRVAKAEKAAADAEARALRREVALEHKLSRDDAELLDALTDEDAMRRLATRLATAESDRKKNGNHVPREGATPPSTEGAAERQFARNLFTEG